MIDQLRLGRTNPVVELPSNDGYLLAYFRERGGPVLGMGPAANVADRAIELGIPTRVELFGVASATRCARC